MPVLILLSAGSVVLLTAQRASATGGELVGIWTINPDGTRTYEPVDNSYYNNHQNNNRITTSISDSTSKADSASGANADVRQNCVGLFCLNIGNANARSASAANSNAESNTNSPRATRIDNSGNNGHSPLWNDIFGTGGGGGGDGTNDHNNAWHNNIGGRDCIDNTGSPNDEGYSFGYFDAQHDRSISSINDHGNHSDQWRQGYRDGFQAGLNDRAEAGIDRNPC